jgi:hypothetical protein
MGPFRNWERATCLTRLWLATCTPGNGEQMKRPHTRSTSEYLRAAVSARARLGIAALAEELALVPERLKSLIWAHYEATRDDTPYMDCLERGNVILATRAELPLSHIENWINDGCDFGGNVACPPALQRVLDSLRETVR